MEESLRGGLQQNKDRVHPGEGGIFGLMVKENDHCSSSRKGFTINEGSKVVITNRCLEKKDI